MAVLYSNVKSINDLYMREMMKQHWEKAAETIDSRNVGNKLMENMYRCYVYKKLANNLLAS